MIQPREYQQHGLQAWLEYLTTGRQNPLMLYPVGVGKSVILAMMLAHALQTWGSVKAIVLTHSKELIQQDYDKLMSYWPTAPAGIYCAGLKREEYWYPITIGSIQTVYNIPELFGHVDFLFVDEAHLISLKEDSMYRSFIDQLLKRNPHLVVTGLTATGWRVKQGMLYQGEGALFDGVAVDACGVDAYNWFFEQGYLIRPMSKKLRYQYDLSKVRTQAGEFHDGDLDQATNQKDINEKVTDMCLEVFYEEGRQSGLIFGCNIKHVDALYKIYKDRGERVTYVHNKMSAAERDYNIAAFKAGEFTWMINNGILTTGFDHPMLDFIGFKKATKRSNLWVQMLGRGTRPLYSPGYDLSDHTERLASIAASPKSDFRVMDFGRNAERLGPINDPVLPYPRDSKKKPGEAPIRICDECGTYNHAAAPECMACGYVFPRREHLQAATTGAKLVKERIAAPTITIEPEYHWFKVDAVVYKMHQKKDSLPCLRVTYQCGFRSFEDFVHLEPGSPFQGKGRSWWIQRASCKPNETPNSVAEAIAKSDILREPNSIKVQVNLKHPKVVDYEYSESTTEA